MITDYKIFIDAACDIDSKYITSGAVNVLTMSYSTGSKMVECTGTETSSDIKHFYDGQREGDLTTTSQLSQANYEEAFQLLVRHGIGVIYLSLSSALSPSYRSAMAAKASLVSKYGPLPLAVLDTVSATGGIGILAERAIMNKMAGYSFENNVNEISALCGKVHSWFYVNDLDYLKRNGKTSATKSLIGTLLGVKPILEISSDGQLRQIDKKFGSKKACEVLKDLYNEHSRSLNGFPVYITHADDPMSANRVKSLIQAEDFSSVIKIRTLSPIVGAHTGPGIIALHHIGKL